MRDLAREQGKRPASRIASIDVIRGAIMLLMAVDHVRLYLTNAGFDPMDLSRTSVPLFLTRWVTHFCAPGFVFLAGTGAYLRGRRGSRGSLAGFLFVRGMWLILLELTVVRLGWTFNFDYRHYVLLGVLWMLGWAMVALAGLVFLPYPAIAAFGFLVVFGHNLIDRWLPSHYESLQEGPLGWLWQIAYLGGTIAPSNGPVLAVLYSLIPWIGVIALGYTFGRVLTWPDERRRRACLAIGGGAIFLFLVLRGANLYGNPSPWRSQPSAAFTVLSFLNTRKYPASLLFLLMTLGPAILTVPLAERLRGTAGRFLQVFGRVPLFFYVLHIWLAHAIAAALSAVRYGGVIPWMFANHPYMPGPHPDGYGYALPVVWMVTALVAALLYPACRAFANLKARRPGGWLSLL